MTGLYQGRYLIAVYNNEDELINVLASPSEYITRNGNKSPSSIRRMIKSSKHVHLIDCLEIHDDVFAEEDKKFIEYAQGHEYRGKYCKSITAIAHELNISERTFYRWRSAGKLKNKLKEYEK